jgi:hypothetical protein
MIDIHLSIYILSYNQISTKNKISSIKCILNEQSFKFDHEYSSELF